MINRGSIIFIVAVIFVILMLVALTTVNAFECVGTGTSDCLQCHAVQAGIHTSHWSRKIGLYPNCAICHCGQQGASTCDTTSRYGPVETICCTSCHDKCIEVNKHTYSFNYTTTTVEPTTTVVSTTSTIDTSTTTIPDTTTTSIETTSTTTIDTPATIIEPLTLCLPCHADCSKTTSSISVIQRMHNGRCSSCHPSRELHAEPGHEDCASCHRGGVPRAGNVNAGTCTASCHPSGRPGTCNLVNDHDPALETDCLNCHQRCIVSTTTTTMPDCSISIQPPVDAVYSEQTVQFTAQTSGEGCLPGVYRWHLVTVINSQLDADGRYTSGFNNAGQSVTDTLVVEDSANRVSIEWPIVVRFEKIIRVVPTTLWRLKWAMFPQVMNIQGEGTHFNNESTVVIFHPAASVIPSWQMVLTENLIWSFLLVMPAWYAGEHDEEVMLMVITHNEILTKTVTIDQFPLHIGGNN